MNLLTVTEVARMLRLSRSKIYNLKDKIGWYRVGGSVRFREEDILRYLDGCRIERNGKRKKRTTGHRLRHLA